MNHEWSKLKYKTVLPYLWNAASCVLLIFLLSGESQAAEPCEPVVGRLVSVEGWVELQRAADSAWLPAKLEDTLCQGDTVRAGERSRAAVALINQTVLRIDQSTAVRLVDILAKEEDRSILSLLWGAIQSFSRKPRRFEVNTPFLNGSVEGTEFFVRVEKQQTLLSVFEGQVLASNDQGRLAVDAGKSVVAQAGEAPQLRIVVRPRDAVQWSLYYPPVLAALGGRVDYIPADVPPPLREAMEIAGSGNTAAALAALNRVAAAERDVPFYLYRAALLLAVGRVEEARTDIDKALRLDPNAGLAYALRAIIHVTQNEREQALENGERAVALSQTAAAKIALSYAQQAAFHLEAARDNLLSAVAQHPDDPLAWARLSELWLMLGDRKQANETAEKAASLAPAVARAQLTLGFAALAEFRNTAAKAAFERAIALNSADPLARLGLGLAKISAGKLEPGRRELEIAVALDWNNALLRAYLGKAYFEEKRAPLAGEQYALAKGLDPLDPTAYFYDGILKQTINKPVEALADLQESLERNDNRAVYRSRLLLDKDRAARGTSLARVYNDLGFEQLGINESTYSLVIDPANASAHRFLSDTYLGMRRREISRVSELLQAQLMQDININPVQPSVAETNLNIITFGGPATPGFNEFTPLFQRNGTQLNATGFGGNNNTYGGEAVATALYDRYSLSLGGFTYNTDGWRPNNELDQNIYDVYAQAAITPALNIQAEFRHRDSKEGDLAFNFDPDNFLPDKTIKRDQNTARVGLRYSPTPNSTALVSYIYSDSDEKNEQSEDLDPFTTLSINSKVNDKSSQIEAQYIYQKESLNLLLGGGYYDVDSKIEDDISLTDITFGPVLSVDESSKESTKQPRTYLYANLDFMESVTWTLGASYDKYDQDPLEITSFNPKFGVQWDVTNDLRLRAAAFKVLIPLLANNRTIEPTQVAGFNQFFDDTQATKFWRYGAGFDWRLRQNLYWGGEVTWRYLDEPVLDTVNGERVANLEDRKEQFHNVYLYWTPLPRWSVKAAFSYDRYESETGIVTEFDNLPEKVRTISVPIAVNYFNPSGLFAGIGGTFVDQEVKRSEFATQGQGDNSFFLVDFAVGYRFPKRLGIASLGIKNLFDKDFKYQDDSYREFRDEPSTGPYFPERTILGRITLNF